MPDNKKDQNDASDGDDHFFSYRRAIKSCQNIHVTSRRRSSGVCCRLWMGLGASRVVPAFRFSSICGPENCSPGRRGAPKPGHSRSKVIFHLAAIKHIIARLMANSEES